MIPFDDRPTHVCLVVAADRCYGVHSDRFPAVAFRRHSGSRWTCGCISQGCAMLRLSFAIVGCDASLRPRQPHVTWLCCPLIYTCPVARLMLFVACCLLCHVNDACWFLISAAGRCVRPAGGFGHSWRSAESVRRLDLLGVSM